MSQYIGEDVLKQGINIYFNKYSMKNTELKDFIEALKKAVSKAEKAEEIDIELWSSSWLTNAGVNSIQPKI
jgi:aminopeptidase N